MQESTKTPNETKQTCNELNRKLDNISETLMQKMALLLETQLQLTETISSSIQQPRADNSTYTSVIKQTGKAAIRKEAEPQIESKQKEESDKSSQQETNITNITFTKTQAPVSDNKRGKQREPVIIGNMTEASDIQAGQRRTWLYIGRLHETTTAEKVKDYVQKKGINGVVECEEVDTPGKLKAFKLGIPHDELEIINKAEAWPTGVLVKKYIFRRFGREGSRL